MQYIFITSDLAAGLKMWTGKRAPQWLYGQARWLPVLGECRSVCKLEPDQFPEFTDNLQHGECVQLRIEEIWQYPSLAKQ